MFHLGLKCQKYAFTHELLRVKLCFLQYEKENDNLKQCGLAFKQKTP